MRNTRGLSLTRPGVTTTAAILPLIVCLPFLQNPAGAGSQPTQEHLVTQWLEEASVPFSPLPVASVPDDSVASPFDSFAPVLDGVQIVGLGEATHGTREFFQAKHRLVQFLVEELGFTVLAMEAQYMKCLPIDEYVSGEGEHEDAARLVTANLPGIYQTEEVLALIEWMRDYNETVPAARRVRFAGFDVQTPHRAAEFMRDFLRRAAPEEAERFDGTLSETAPPGFQQFWIEYAERDTERKDSLRSRLLTLSGYLIAEEASLTRRTSREEFRIALRAARVLVQSDEIRSTPESQKQADGDARDRLMADTIDYLRHENGGSEAKMILWAHDFHVWTLPPESTPGASQQRTELSRHQLLFKPLGSYLREQYGSRYYAVGFFFDEGSFQAVDANGDDESMDPLEFTVQASPAGSAASVLRSPRCDAYCVDLRSAPRTGGVAAWLDRPQTLRYAGADFSEAWGESDYAVPVLLREQFDGLVFMDSTSRARPLRHADAAEGSVPSR